MLEVGYEISLEEVVAKFYSPSCPNIDIHPMKMNVARELVENTNIFGNQMTSMLFETYSRQTIKVITKIDDDTKIVVMMTTMTAWKFNKFGIAEWKVIFSAEGYEASWPELRKFRK